MNSAANPSGQGYGTWQESGPTTPSPEGMYGPMYPVPGIMTTEPQGRIVNGNPELEFVEPDQPIQAPQGLNPQSPEEVDIPDSSAVDRMVDGVWEALTKGAKGTEKALEGLADNSDKIIDGAILGGKMAVPVVKYAGEEAVTDALLSYLSECGWPAVKLAANFGGSREMQIVRGLSGARNTAKDIAEEIRNIVNSHKK